MNQKRLNFKDYLLNAEKNNLKEILSEENWNKLNNIYTKGSRLGNLVDTSLDKQIDKTLSVLERIGKNGLTR